MPSLYNRPCEYERGFSNIFEEGKNMLKEEEECATLPRVEEDYLVSLSCETAPSSLNTLYRNKKKKQGKHSLCQITRTKKCAFHHISWKKIFSLKRAYYREACCLACHAEINFHSIFGHTKENIVPLPLSDIHLFPPHDDDCA